MAQEISLLTGAGSGATGSSHSVPEDGWYTVYMFGTFDGGTCFLQVLADNGTDTEWVAIPDSGQTSSWVGRFYLDSGTLVRARVTGGTSPDVNVTMNRSNVGR